jgi:hypothetical protein
MGLQWLLLTAGDLIFANRLRIGVRRESTTIDYHRRVSRRST